MKKLWNLLPLVCLLVFASCKSSHIANDATQPAAQNNTGAVAPYILGPSDQITINVWRNTELSRSLTIDPMGNISMPLAGDINASGLTTAELTQNLEKNLAKYLKNPRVDISVTAVRSARVHIFGEVRSPGNYSMDHNILPLEAIALAGGFLDSADASSVLLVRNTGGKVEATKMNLNIRSGSGRRELANASYLRSGDIVYALPTKIAQMEAFMAHIKNLVSPLVTVEQGIVLWPQVVDAVKGTETSSKTPIAVTP